MLSILYILIAPTFFNMIVKEEEVFNDTIKNFYNNSYSKVIWLIAFLLIIQSLYSEDQINFIIDQVYNIIHPCFYFLIIASVVTFYGALILGGMCFMEPLF